jgi:proteasome accessory factor B
MSFRARMQRISYIDRRLRYKKDYPSARELAEGFARDAGDDVSDRTVKRDIEWLREAQAPIAYDSHRRGYYYTHENFQLPAVHLTEGDLLAILVADRALSSYRNSPFYERLQGVFERLTSLLPRKVSVSSQELATDVTVIPDPVTEISGAVWTVLQDGLERQRTVTITYRAPGHPESVVRRVDPYHIVGFHGEWYLLAWSHHDEEVRVYALARIRDCRLGSRGFDRPGDFDPHSYIDPNFGIFLNEPWVDVAVRFDPPVAARIRERRWHPGQHIEELDHGGIILRFRTNQQSQTLYWVGKWGPNAEILEPAELRERAAHWFRRTAAAYADDDLE